VKIRSGRIPQFKASIFSILTLMTVVIVDDDSDDREVFCSAINATREVNCIELESCPELLLYLASADPLPDYIFMDLHMPKQDGIRCVSEIRSTERYKNIKMVVYTTLISPSQRELLERLKIKVLIKSSELKEIRSSIEEQLV
jgi:CheY-like chemotaxis protein